MRQAGGKGRIGLWVMAFRNPFRRHEMDGSYEVDAGFMLSVVPKRMWLLSFGAKGIGTVGIGWVAKAQRGLDAEAAEHERQHAEGIEHTHP